MSRRHPLFGLALALFGTLMLTPDALLMRLSEMSGFQMAAWRGMMMGTVMILGWALSTRTHRGDLAVLRTRSGLAIVICQVFNSTLFCLGIAVAPVAVVLLGVAAVPVFAACLAWLIIGEPTHKTTWAAMAAVLFGIGLAVSGEGEGLALDGAALLGALFGLGVALVLALNFVILRARPHIPIPLAIGCGAWIAGLISLAIVGPGALSQGQYIYMIVTGGIVLPVSFFCLSLASRYTHAANVSLLMLLETVLGPLWVWLGTGEAPTARMLWGGAIVVISLALYLMVTGQRTKRARAVAQR
nr:DMT family transporter [Roseovarius faecimaris]